MDIAGIDVMAHVARNLTERLTDPESVRAFALPSLVTKLIERGWVGEKAGPGLLTRKLVRTS
jgi:3-hydroxyacyl-CoA dehydrogenase